MSRISITRKTLLPVRRDKQVASSEGGVTSVSSSGGGAVSMVYPAAGVAVSTGTAWDTSLSATNLASIAGLTYTSLSFLKMSAAGTFTLDTNSYSLSSHAHGDITSAGLINSAAITPASGDYILLSDTSASEKIQRGIQIGTSTTTFLRNDGTWATPTGGGVTVTGTPVDNQLAVWTSASSIEGTTGLTYSGTELSVTGDINIPLGNYIKLNTNNAMRQTGNLMQFGWISSGGHFFQTGIADPFLGMYKGSALVLGVDANSYVYVVNRLRVNTIDEYTAATGVTIDGVLLKDNAITATGRSTFSGGVDFTTVDSRFADGIWLEFGTDGDGYLQWSNTNNALALTSVTASSDIRLYPASNCKLYANGTTLRIETTSTGAKVTGILDVNQVRLDSEPDTNGTAEGVITTLTAGASLVAGDVCYMNSSGKMVKADADGTSTYPAWAMCLETLSTDGTGKFLLQGFYRNDSFATMTVGAVLYLSTTAGGVTTTAPTASGNKVQVLGRCTHADRIYFNPSNDYYTIA